MVSFLKMIYGWLMIICGMVLESFLFGVVLWWAWNLVAPEIFSIKAIGLHHAIAMILVTRLLTFNTANWANAKPAPPRHDSNLGSMIKIMRAEFDKDGKIKIEDLNGKKD